MFKVYSNVLCAKINRIIYIKCHLKLLYLEQKYYIKQGAWGNFPNILPIILHNLILAKEVCKNILDCTETVRFEHVQPFHLSHTAQVSVR